VIFQLLEEPVPALAGHGESGLGADPERHGLPPRGQGHHRGKGHGAEGQAFSSVLDYGDAFGTAINADDIRALLT
jgi:hypothetical protein